RAVVRSFLDLTSQARTRSRMASSINQATTLKNLGFKRRANIPEAFQFGSRFHQNVLGDAQTSETTMRTLGAADRWLCALAHYHQQVEGMSSFLPSSTPPAARKRKLYS